MSLSDAVKEFTGALLRLPDSALRQPWPGKLGDDGWKEYSDTLNDIAFLALQKLRALTVDIESSRETQGPRITVAHRILAQHQAAYRDFCGMMAGVRDEELDITPFAKRWSLRHNLAHILVAECWSQGPQILHALEQRRAGKGVVPRPVPEVLDEDGTPPDFGSVSELLARLEFFHDRLIRRLMDIRDDELETHSIYWEDESVDVRFRMYRFAWHLRSHTIQTDKIRLGLGHQLTDMDRLTRLIYTALGEAEGALIGAGEAQHELASAVVAAILARSEEIKRFYSLSVSA